VHALPAGARAEDVFAFDTGPANMVMDQLAVIASKGRQSYDKGSRLAMKGHVDRNLLDELLRGPYFRQAPPKSAGREQYGEEFIARLLATQLPIEDLMATATACTAATVALGIERFIAPKFAVEECIAAGGGVHNPLLMSQLQGFLPGMRVYSIEELGIAADAKEAIAFALLAVATHLGRPSNLPTATGARHSVVLGQINPGR
jgi:anhydro-N-acetylmuramic acid kinase